MKLSLVLLREAQNCFLKCQGHLPTKQSSDELALTCLGLSKTRLIQLKRCSNLQSDRTIKIDQTGRD